MGMNTPLETVDSLRGIRDALMRIQGDLSLPQFVALMTIGLEPGLSVNELAEKLNIPQQSASRYIAVLTGRYQSELASGIVEPLIVQQINELDPRKRALHLTPSGTELLASLLGSSVTLS
jgi:DNA-binding MarR family transcriptional regulator